MFTSIQIYFAWNIPASKSVKAAASKKNSTALHPSDLCTGQCAALWSTTSQGIGFIMLAASAVSLSHQPTFFLAPKNPAFSKSNQNTRPNFFPVSGFFSEFPFPTAAAVFSLNTWRSEQIFGASDSKRRRCKEHQRVPRLCINIFFYGLNVLSLEVLPSVAWLPTLQNHARREPFIIP